MKLNCEVKFFIKKALQKNMNFDIINLKEKKKQSNLMSTSKAL